MLSLTKLIAKAKENGKKRLKVWTAAGSDLEKIGTHKLNITNIHINPG